jgi:hypothetical protein
MTIGQGALFGRIPLIDMFDQKGPILYFIQFLGQWLSYGKMGIFVLQVLNLTIFLGIVNAIIKLWDVKHQVFQWFVFLVLLMATFEGGNLCEEWSLNFQMIPLYLFLKDIKRNTLVRSYWHTFIYGLCFAVILFIRPNNGVVNVAIVLALLIYLVREKSWMALLKHVLAGVGGCAVIILPIVIFYWRHHGLYDLMYCAFLYNFKYIDKWGVVTAGLIADDCWKLLPCVLLLGGAIWYRKRIDKDVLTLSICLALVSLYVYYRSWGYYHYFLFLVPVLILLFLVMSFIGEKKKETKIWGWLIVASMTAYFAIIPGRAKFILGYDIVYNNDWLYGKIGTIEGLPLRHAEAEYDKIVSFIPETERSDVYIYNTFPYSGIMLRTGFVPVGKNFFLQDDLFHVDDRIRQETYNDLFAHTPLWIVATHVRDRNVNSLIETRYRKVYVSKIMNGVSLYRRI